MSGVPQCHGQEGGPHGPQPGHAVRAEAGWLAALSQGLLESPCVWKKKPGSLYLAEQILSLGNKQLVFFWLLEVPGRAIEEPS